jgi:hypothetical protein
MFLRLLSATVFLALIVLGTAGGILAPVTSAASERRTGFDPGRMAEPLRPIRFSFHPREEIMRASAPHFGWLPSQGSPVAVGFIFPLKPKRAYAEFDVTGRQLIVGRFAGWGW